MLGLGHPVDGGQFASATGGTSNCPPAFGRRRPDAPSSILARLAPMKWIALDESNLGARLGARMTEPETALDIAMR